MNPRIAIEPHRTRVTSSSIDSLIEGADVAKSDRCLSCATAVSAPRLPLGAAGVGNDLLPPPAVAVTLT